MTSTYISDWPPFSPSDNARRENVLVAAQLMMNAALTAPCAGGTPQIEGCIVDGHDDFEKIARKMEELSYEKKVWERPFKYEAVMVRESDAIVLLGNHTARNNPLDLACGLCGGKDDCSYVYEKRDVCAGRIDHTKRTSDKPIDGPLCSFRVHDLGYAVGTALWMAARLFVDTRPMWSVGMAAQKLGYCPNSPIVVAIPISATAKNPYVDIHPDYHVINRGTMIDSVRRAYVIARQSGADYRKYDPRPVKNEEGDDK